MVRRTRLKISSCKVGGVIHPPFVVLMAFGGMKLVEFVAFCANANGPIEIGAIKKTA
ncbi:MAG: hypothetical protein KGI33_07405 [Thaumarchaeota archaeon]|nr:hypothetical protein [Nitrososphaerota archaeon]